MERVYNIIISIIFFIMGILTHKLKVKIGKSIDNRKLNKDLNKNRNIITIWKGPTQYSSRKSSTIELELTHKDNKLKKKIKQLTDIGFIKSSETNAYSSFPIKIYYQNGEYIANNVPRDEVLFLDVESGICNKLKI